MPDRHTAESSSPESPIGTPQWIINLVASPDPRHFGPFADEDEALGWGFDNLADFEPEEWEPYPLSLLPPDVGGEGT